MRSRGSILLLLFGLLACSKPKTEPPAPSAPAAPAPAPAPAAKGEAMVSAAHPLAVEAGLEILRAGGTATDAAIAVSLVLGLVEPQSSGLGGGGFLLHFDNRTNALAAYDGRETAPAGATPDMFLDASGKPLPFLDVQTSGRSIGVPTLVAMLELAHRAHGKLPWARLFDPAIRLAENGFALSPRLHKFLMFAGGKGGRLKKDAAASRYFYQGSGEPWPIGHALKNPDYAATLRQIAKQGSLALRQGPLAEQIVAVAQRAPLPGSLALADLAQVMPRELKPICGGFLGYRVCSVGAPTSGAATIELLGLYERLRPKTAAPASADAWSAFLWASRLAYADRDHYVADERFVPVPDAALVSPQYLDARTLGASVAQAPRAIVPGKPAGEELFARWGRDTSGDKPGTTHFSIVDAEGNAVALTQTVEALFGAQRMVGGFLLNNQLTDFAWKPEIEGRPVANAIAPGKKPRSSMSPMIVTRPDGELELVLGSPGGSSIIAYVARAAVSALDWGMPLSEAVSGGNVVARSKPARLETSRFSPEIRAQLEARGWAFEESNSEASGLHAIRVTPHGLEGAADPRREGIVGTVPAPPSPPPKAQ